MSVIVDKKTTILPELRSQRITLNSAGRSLRAVLDEIAQSFEITWTYRDEALVLLPEQEEESVSVTRVYDLSGLPTYRGNHGEGVPDYEHIKNMITETVNNRSWSENGGHGTIAEYDKSGIHGIAVSQTWRTHLEIEALLGKLRALRGRAITAADIEKLPRAPHRIEAADDPPSPPLSADPRREAVVAANNRFALDLYKKVGGGNRLFSPSCLSTALAMIYSGARGKTAEEMARTLHLTVPQPDVAAGYQSFLASLPSADRAGCTLTAANQLWGQRDYGFLDAYCATARRSSAAA